MLAAGAVCGVGECEGPGQRKTELRIRANAEKYRRAKVSVLMPMVVLNPCFAISRCALLHSRDGGCNQLEQVLFSSLVDAKQRYQNQIAHKETESLSVIVDTPALDSESETPSPRTLQVIYKGTNVFHERPVFICFPQNVSLHWYAAVRGSAAHTSSPLTLF